jgi:Tfp pilus assembly protein PilF
MLPRSSLLLMVATLLAAGCAQAPPKPPSGLAELMEQPAERALIEGIRAYDDGNYATAETSLRKALDSKALGGLKSGRDQATAHKLLAFITCTSDRLPACEAEFRAARAADPAFVLTRSESGHPVWGPVYQRVLR